jgi:hypothetical protein
MEAIQSLSDSGVLLIWAFISLQFNFFQIWVERMGSYLLVNLSKLSSQVRAFYSWDFPTY